MTQRPYNSTVRKRQAEETRKAITDAAERLFVEQGYERTTIGAVAAAAEVSPQTVYAGFGSKQGLLVALLESFVHDQSFDELYYMALRAENPRESMGYIVGIVCKIFQSTGQLHEMLRGSVATSPELQQLMRERQQLVRGCQEELVRHFYDAGHIRKDIDFETALDTHWCLLTRESYHLLVEEQRWPVEKYKTWLHGLVCDQLFGPDPAASMGYAGE